MKLSFFTCLVLCCSISFAQLSVQNDAYVFVKNEQIFVTDDVNIDDANSKIYLRDEAQLLQGNGTTGNSGVGQLSVFQTGTSNTYMYNYWCSPVGLNTGIAGNTDFRPTNNLYGETAAPITSLAATYVAEPNYNGVAGAVGIPPVIASFWLYSFIGTTAAPNEYVDWNPLDETSGILGSGYGWTMKGNPSSAQQYDFRGRPNNGTITTTLNANRETLVGNPYPSAIDARAYIHDTNNAALINSATLSFWEQDPVGSSSHVLTNYNGGYATYTINASGPVVEMYTPATFDTYNADGTVNTTGGASTTGKSIFRYIPIGQGFTVESNGTGGTLRTTNAMRVFQKEAATLSEFFRVSNNEDPSTNDEGNYNESGLSIVPEGYKRFRLNLDFNETYTRQLAQTFHHTATTGEDYGLETTSPDALAADAYWPQGEKAFNAQAFNFDVSLHIPMVININEVQPLRFRIFDVQNFEESQSIYIHDIENDVYVDLRNQNYDIIIEPGNYTERFEIVFATQALGVEDFDVTSLNIHQNNKDHQLSVHNPNGLDIKTIEVYDVAGKRMIQSHFDAVEDQYNLSTLRLSDGVYVVNVSTHASTKAKSQKIIVKN